MDMAFDYAIANQYPDANLDFYRGNGASFNRTGTMEIVSNDGRYLYEIRDGKLYQVDADHSGDTFTFKTAQ
jgi:hypothetical protein